jgi:hypothetical protein
MTGTQTRLVAALASLLAAVTLLAGVTACAHPGPRNAGTARPVPSPLYGVTVDDVTELRPITASLRHLPVKPTTRIYLDVKRPPAHYTAAVRALRPISYVMGELLDSSDETHISVRAYDARVKSYLAAFRDKIDIWEIGNEVNGNWTGTYPTVRAKLVTAYRDVAGAGKPTALTLYHNIGCGDGPAELDPVAFTRRYVPQAVRDGLDYVLLSYYEDSCGGVRPSAATWTAYFQKLHTLYPHALLGFGEIGMTNPVTARTLGSAESLARYYYGLTVKLPYYIGGYFWWYYAEDYSRRPMWRVLRQGFQAEASSWRRR